MSWKYVFLKVGNTEVPVIFPERMVHALMADAVKSYFVREARTVYPDLSPGAARMLADQMEPLSAGSCEVIVRHAVGHSETLKLKARPDDEDRLNTNPYTGGLLP